MPMVSMVCVCVQIRNYAESWGWQVPAFDSRALRLFLIDSVSRMGHSVTVILGGVLDVVSNVGRFVVAVVTFMSCLYYFLESGQSLVVCLARGRAPTRPPP